MIIKYQRISVSKENISPEEHGKSLADELFWKFNENLEKPMSNEEAQICVESFIIQLFERFNLQGYNLDKEGWTKSLNNNTENLQNYNLKL